MTKNVAFFHGAPKKKRSYADFIDLSEEIVRQCRGLLSTVEKDEIKLKLNSIITLTLNAVKAVDNKSYNERQNLLVQLREISLSLPSQISTQNQSGYNSQLAYISDIIANICLFVVVLTLSSFAGHLFYVGFHGAYGHYFLEELVDICSSFIIPFGLMGLFANYVSHSVSDKHVSVDALTAVVTELCHTESVSSERPSEQEGATRAFG